MKRVVMLMALALSILSLSASDVSSETSNGPNTFPTMAACEAALESGNFRYYIPRYHGLKNRNPVDGVNLIRVPLETDLCIKMQVVGRRSYVVQKEGTQFRAQRQRDGSLLLAYRDDCGNPVYEGVLPAPAVAAVVPEPEPEPARVFIPQHLPPPPVERVVYREREKKGGFCSSTKCRLLVLGAAAGLGYGIYYNWPCPPGTSRR